MIPISKLEINRSIANSYANGNLQQEVQATNPEASLIDNTDEIWVVLMPFSCTRANTLFRALASGLLLKRGAHGGIANLPSIAIDLVDIIPPRIADGGVNWLNIRSLKTVLME